VREEEDDEADEADEADRPEPTSKSSAVSLLRCLEANEGPHGGAPSSFDSAVPPVPQRSRTIDKTCDRSTSLLGVASPLGARPAAADARDPGCCRLAKSSACIARLRCREAMCDV